MVFRATISNPNQPDNSIEVFFPMLGPESYYQQLSEIGIGNAVSRDCLISDIHSEYSVLTALSGAIVNVDELDYLAKRLNSFWGPEATQFEGIAAAKGITGIEDFINLTFSCHTVTVVSDFYDLEAVGKAHFLNKNGGAVPTSAMEGVDFKKEALDLLQSGNGTVTPYGLVFDNGMDMERLYKGIEFPPYLYEPPAAVLWARHESTPDATPTCLYLPMSEERIERALERGGWKDDWSDMALEFEAHKVSSDLLRTIDVENENPVQLNEMVRAIAAVDENDLPKLHAAVELAEPPDAYSLGNLAKCLYQFGYVRDITNAEEFGRWAIAESGRHNYDAELDEFYDFKGYGERQMEYGTGLFLEGGGYVYVSGDMSLDEILQGPNAPEQGMTMGGM
jgi:hypothetical protein